MVSPSTTILFKLAVLPSTPDKSKLPFTIILEKVTSSVNVPVKIKSPLTSAFAKVSALVTQLSHHHCVLLVGQEYQ